MPSPETTWLDDAETADLLRELRQHGASVVEAVRVIGACPVGGIALLKGLRSVEGIDYRRGKLPLEESGQFDGGVED